MRIVFKNHETFSGALCFIFSLYLLFEISKFPPTLERIRALGPDIFPKILAYSLAALSLALWLTGLRAQPAPVISPAYQKPEYARAAILVATILSFIFLLETLGFIVWGVLCMCLVQYAFGERRVLPIGIISITVTMSIYLLFATILNVPLPQGIIPL